MTQPQRIEQPDPLIDDVRRIRAKLDKQYGNDWKGYADHLRKTAANLQGKSAGLSDDVKVKKEEPH